MSEYLAPCTTCNVARERLESLQAVTFHRGVALRLMDQAENIDRTEAPVEANQLAVDCQRCNGHGAVLTPAGLILAAVIGQALKGTVIV